MKQLIVLVGILLMALSSNAQANSPYIDNGSLDTIVINDVKQIKKKRETVKKQCIKIDTAISQMRSIKAIQEKIIAKLKERKEQRTNGEIY